MLFSVLESFEPLNWKSNVKWNENFKNVSSIFAQQFSKSIEIEVNMHCVLLNDLWKCQVIWSAGKFLLIDFGSAIRIHKKPFLFFLSNKVLGRYHLIPITYFLRNYLCVKSNFIN